MDDDGDGFDVDDDDSDDDDSVTYNSNAVRNVDCCKWFTSWKSTLA